MKVYNFITMSILAVTLSACGGSDSSPVIAEPTASYELEFKTNWSASNFSTNFPIDRHFSGLIGLTHNSNVKIFEVGTVASNGIVSMAETGSKVLLKEEIEALQNLGHSSSTVDGLGIPAELTSVSVTFDVSQDHPLVSVVTMIAPSPDWFTGINSIPLFVNGQWIEEIEFQLVAYDAGSDNGLTFTSANSVTNPRGVITKLTSERTDTDFENGVHFLTSLSIGSFKLNKIN